uniref:Uncharacterized protein n=1 Tax=Anguilla anguilla TaxID=7936 RepID=A0A0E9PI72_ANGAN
MGKICCGELEEQANILLPLTLADLK